MVAVLRRRPNSAITLIDVGKLRDIGSRPGWRNQLIDEPLVMFCKSAVLSGSASLSFDRDSAIQLYGKASPNIGARHAAFP
jgi:hypothetical protein